MEEFMGTIKLFAGNFAPVGYLTCEGQSLPISQNTALFSLLGITYGGNGVTTFKLPDLRGRVPVGAGNGPGLSPKTAGEVDGFESNTISIANMPAHNHTAVANVSNANSDVATPATGSSIAVPGNAAGRGFTSSLGFNSATPNVALNPVSVQVASNGGSQPMNNMQPYLGLMYIICVQGIYPTRP
jgi:microcystin-dependent protein